MSTAHMPRRVENVSVLLDEQILDPNFEQGRFEQVFFCGYGHDFVISFASEEEAECFSAAQCPTCTALAPTFPAGEADPAIIAPDLPGRGVTALPTPLTEREEAFEVERVSLAVAAA